ncbi:sensor histidine kinase [Aquabacterium sp.]|uniref:sensor histidine kinase n=1 Tax=Aquabacterium sp. TaxID=1872578 RepID=UPI002CF2312A|nr:ATP-binding protein [Aquabacterium sp.]HSW04245.1 ATP-binding protein [Aquabacterium sp.]
MAEKLRLVTAALAWLAAGALGHAAGESARVWVGAVLLALLGLWLARPLMRRTVVASPQPAEPPPPVDEQRLALLQAQMEHLPVAAWVLAGERLQALSSRARRLVAPGAVRDAGALRHLLGHASGSGPVVLDTERGSERWQLLRQALALDGQDQTLLVLVPLEQALESESLAAWQQLVRVLTHEIMNSLTPIKSLSQTAQTLLDESGAGDELRSALDAIARRAESLSGFVTTYRRVGQSPAPVMAPVDLRALFARLQQAVGPAWQARGGEARFELASPTLRLQADEGQLEQALLALLSNAEQATANQAVPRLWVQGRQTRGGRLQISVRDNGPGVPAGLERQIFIPFFSAREGGQGIGLTVVRQLAYGMGGRVRHVRPLEGGAAFVLSF